jgi:hypothetical protein
MIKCAILMGRRYVLYGALAFHSVSVLRGGGGGVSLGACPQETPNCDEGKKDETFDKFVAEERLRVQRTAKNGLTKEELFWHVKDYSPTEPSRA